MNKELTCIVCPRGCTLSVEMENDRVVSVTGNTCKRGAEYAKSECTNPQRTITSTVRCKNGSVLPVKTDKTVPKALIFDCMREINKYTAENSALVGDVLIENILNTGANVVATANMQ